MDLRANTFLSVSQMITPKRLGRRVLSVPGHNTLLDAAGGVIVGVTSVIPISLAVYFSYFSSRTISRYATCERVRIDLALDTLRFFNAGDGIQSRRWAISFHGDR